MGNKLAALSPSHLTSTEQVLQDVAYLKLEKELGSSPLFKVARARHEEWNKTVVVKAFLIPVGNIHLPLEQYKSIIHQYRTNCDKQFNILPYENPISTDKAVLLLRDYVDHSLQERMNTLPYLIMEEKKWIAFQLLCALHQLHNIVDEESGSSYHSQSTPLCHGDVKMENVFLTDWGWLFLADMAPFKPAYLPVDNPTEYGFFFDIARRQACNLAPERFIDDSSSKELEEVEENLAFQENNFAAPGSEVPVPPMRPKFHRSKSIVKQPLEPAMDMFSCGCVLLELFADTRRAFSLSELLNYRNGTMYTSPKQLPLLQSIPDKHVQELICQLLEPFPVNRKSASDCLMMHRGKTFPEFFYRFLKSDMKWFLTCDADSRIFRIKNILNQILDQQLGDRSQPSLLNSSLIIQINVITASICQLRSEPAKMDCLTLLQEFAKYLVPDLVLNRIVPYMVELLQGHNSSEVRRHAIECITQCVQRIRSVPTSESDFFPEYLFPAIQKEVTFENKSAQLEIKLAIAMALPVLAKTALRFLNSAHENRLALKESDELAAPTISYDKRLSVVRHSVRDIVVNLMSDGQNAIREVISQPQPVLDLCSFFGVLECNEAVLSHVVTFLNDKDPHLRLSFLRMLPPVAMFCGAQWTHILHSLLELETHDSCELVLEQCMRCLARLIRLRLLDRSTQRQLVLYGALPLLAHPSVSIRSSALHVLVQFAHCACPAEVYCLLMTSDAADNMHLNQLNSKSTVNSPLPKPTLNLYFKNDAPSFTDEYTLWQQLRPPIPTTVFQMVVTCGTSLSSLFAYLNDRRQVREMTRTGSRPSYSCSDESIAHTLVSLYSVGLTEDMETQLCYLQPLLEQLQMQYRSSTPEDTVKSSATLSSGVGKAAAHKYTLPPVEKVNVQLHPTLLPKLREGGQQFFPPQTVETAPSNGVANQEWRHMFMADPQKDNHSSTKGVTAVNSVVLTPEGGRSSPALKHVPYTPMIKSGASNISQASSLSQESARILENMTLYELTSRHLQQAISNGHYSPKALQQHIADSMKFSLVETSRSGAVGQASYYYAPQRLGDSGIPSTSLSTSNNVFDASQPQTMVVLPGGHANTTTTRSGGVATLTTTGAGGQASNTPVGLSHSMWKPCGGVLLAHLHEHKVGPVYLASSMKGDYFVSAGNVGEVKLWRLGESHTVLPTRATSTFHAPRESANAPSQCRDLVWIRSGSSVVTCVDRSAIHIVDCERGQEHHGFPVAEQEGRCITVTTPQPTFTDYSPMDPMSLPLAGDNFFMYATTHYLLIGHDLRVSPSKGHAWQANLDSSSGLPTCMSMQSDGTWVTVGTNLGHLITWDLRFRLPISRVKHPSSLAVSAIKPHPATQRGEASWVFAAHQYNNEVSLWDLETNQRRGVLWASTVPSLSRNRFGAHTVHALLIGGPGSLSGGRADVQDNPSVPNQHILSENCYAVTGGTDWRLRYWHLGDASRSSMLALAAGREESLADYYHTSYASHIVEGTLIYSEDMKRPRPEDMSSLLEESFKSAGNASHGHSNIVTGLALLSVDGSTVLVSSSADGVIKMWK